MRHATDREELTSLASTKGKLGCLPTCDTAAGRYQDDDHSDDAWAEFLIIIPS